MRINARILISLALLVFCIVPAMGQVVINEIMYNSLPGPGGLDVEYVEIYNVGVETVNLNGWYMVDDDPAHPHCQLVGSLAPGAYMVIVADLTLFAQQYPGISNININGFDSGGNGFGLGNSSDSVNIHDDLGQLVDTVAYEDGGPWPGSADGGGPSLELLDFLLDNSLPESWDPSLYD